MIETMKMLVEKNGMSLDETFSVILNRRKYFIKVEDLIENAADLDEERIKVHVQRLEEAQNKTTHRVFLVLGFMGCEILRKKPELAASLKSEPLDD